MNKKTCLSWRFNKWMLLKNGLEKDGKGIIFCGIRYFSTFQGSMFKFRGVELKRFNLIVRKQTMYMGKNDFPKLFEFTL